MRLQTYFSTSFSTPWECKHEEDDLELNATRRPPMSGWYPLSGATLLFHWKGRLQVQPVTKSTGGQSTPPVLLRLRDLTESFRFWCPAWWPDLTFSATKEVSTFAPTGEIIFVLPEGVESRYFPVSSNIRSVLEFPSCSDRGAKHISSKRFGPAG
jgi:hypothetical protein